MSKGTEIYHYVLLKDSKEASDAFYCFEKVEKISRFCDLFILKRQCIYSS